MRTVSLSLLVILSLSLWDLIFAIKTLYIHIGPHKSGSTHIQTVLTRLAANLSEYGVCWAAEDAKLFHPLAVKLFEGERLNRSNSDLFAGINNCLAHHPVTIVSSETFVKLNPEAIRHLRNLFPSQEVQIRIVAVYRDWFMRLYSAYGEFAKRAYSTLCTFQYFLSVIFEPGPRVFYSNDLKILKKYEDVFGHDALTIIDYAGASAAGKDLAAILICEMLKVPCDELPDVFHERENAAREKRAYEVLMLFRELAWMRGCAINPVYNAVDKLDELAREYVSYLDLLPTFRSKFEQWKELSVKKRKEFDSLYANRTLYGNSQAALPSLMHFSLPVIDYDLLYGNITFQHMLKMEVSNLISRFVFVNCSDV
eukprot:gene1467-1595_t